MGLLLAAPAVLPFLQLMQAGDVGYGHVFAPFSLSSQALVALLSPYALGLQGTAASFDLKGGFAWIHAGLGGYLSLALLLAALLGLAGRHERSLRWLLLAWCVLALGRTAGVPGIAQLVNAVPLISFTEFFRYAPPSLELAATVLAAFALDDWRRGEGSRRAVLLATVVAFAAGAAAILAARPLIKTLLAREPHYAWWLWGSVLWTGGVTAAVGLLLLSTPRRRWQVALAALLTLDMLVPFTIPGFSAPRRAELDGGVLHYLAQHLGLQRFHSMGPLSPNYGAYFRLASINSFYTPTPRTWSDHITGALDPYAAPLYFIGGVQSAFPTDKPDPNAVLRAHLAGYEELGVRYVLAWHNTNPFIETALSDVAASGNQAHPLVAGQEFSRVFPTRRLKAGRVASLGVLVGTYGGAANGHLKVELCADLVCREGTADLSGAADGGSFDVLLDTPLEVAPGAVVRYRIVHTDGREAVALWLWPEPSAPLGAPLVPRVALTYVGPAPPPARVYAGDVADIYELLHPKPYFEVRGGDCTLTYSGREKVAADCRAPATLVRRELAFPGWHATVNDAAVPVQEVVPLFQAVRLPAGTSQVRFRYWPPYIGWAYAAALLGLTGLATGCWPGRRPSAKRPAW